MMMKIFGAVLIVSGGFLIGKIRADQMMMRLCVLSDLAELFCCFDRELREQRRSINEVFSEKGILALQILERQPIQGLNHKEQQRLTEHLDCLRTASYRESLDKNKAFIAQLQEMIEALKREHSSGGKALPLVTSTIGLFVAVMLF